MTVWIIGVAWFALALAIAFKGGWAILGGYALLTAAVTWWLFSVGYQRGDLAAVFGFLGLAMLIAPAIAAIIFRTAYLCIRAA